MSLESDSWMLAAKGFALVARSRSLRVEGGHSTPGLTLASDLCSSLASRRPPSVASPPLPRSKRKLRSSQEQRLSEVLRCMASELASRAMGGQSLSEHRLCPAMGTLTKVLAYTQRAWTM